MLSNAVTNRMIDELETLLAEIRAGQQPSNLALEEAVRKRVCGDMLREEIDAHLPGNGGILARRPRDGGGWTEDDDTSHLMGG